MKQLSVGVALFGLLALVLAATMQDAWTAGLGVAVLLCAFTTYRSAGISSFLKIFVSIFSIETIVFGLTVLAARGGLWPQVYEDYELPESLPLSVAIFSIAVYVVAQADVVRQITRIAEAPPIARSQPGRLR